MSSEVNEFDIDRLDPLSNEIAQMLVREFPDVRLLNEANYLVANWVSQNPRVTEDLVLSTKNEPELYWHWGYMYDFPVDMIHPRDQVVEAIRSFLQGFFEEQIACGRSEHGGGGPVEIIEGGYPSWVDTAGGSTRTWRGTHDRDF